MAVEQSANAMIPPEKECSVQYINNVYSMPGLQQWDIIPGVNLYILNIQPDQIIETQEEREDKKVAFNFTLTGNAKAVTYNGTSASTINVQPGAAISHYVAGGIVTTTIFANEPVQMLSVDLDFSFLESLLEEEDCYLTEQTLSSPETMLNYHSVMSPLQKMIVNLMLSCPMRGAAGKLFLQSKVLELTSYQLAAMAIEKTEKVAHTNTALPEVEAEKIRHAREILKKNMTDPPLLSELADMTGINVNKLNKGFRILYGKTAFRCLHEDRMEYAHALLSQRNLNVSEVAWEVGYTNVGHFSGAFLKHYGIKPKTFQLEIGKQYYAIP